MLALHETDGLIQSMVLGDVEAENGGLVTFPFRVAPLPPTIHGLHGNVGVVFVMARNGRNTGRRRRRWHGARRLGGSRDGALVLVGIRLPRDGHKPVA